MLFTLLSLSLSLLTYRLATRNASDVSKLVYSRIYFPVLLVQISQQLVEKVQLYFLGGYGLWRRYFRYRDLLCIPVLQY